MKRQIVALAMMVSLLAVVGNAWGVVQYIVTDLGMLPGGRASWARGINNSGQVVGYSERKTSDGTYYYEAFLWQSGSGMQNLGTLGGTRAWAIGINDSGQVVGRAYTSGYDVQHAFLWQSGTGMQDLGTLGGTDNSSARGINNSGQVVGTTYVNHLAYSNHAFLWQNGGGMQNLGTLGGTDSVAYGINNSGQVVGQSYTSGNRGYHAFLWQSGSGMQDLGTLGGGGSWADDINNSGQVVGLARTSIEDGHAFLWQSGTGMQDLGTLGGFESEAYGINNSGQVVGYSQTSDNYRYHAFLWQSGSGMQDLNALIALNSGWVDNAFAINDWGQIVGSASIGGYDHAVLLTPIPEPSTLVLLGIGALGLLACAWRRRWVMKRLTSCGRILLAVFGIWLWLSSHVVLAVVPGNLFVATWGSGNIYKFTPDGSQSTFASGLKMADGLAFDCNGNLFEADYGSNNIYEFRPDGTRSTFASGLDGPETLAFDGSGNLFSSDGYSGQIYKFTPSGSRSTFASGLMTPIGLAFDGSGNLFEADTRSGNIYKFTPSGSRSTFASGLYGPWGLAFDGGGNLFMSDYASNTIYKFTPDGSRSTFVSGLDYPAAIAFDSSGNLFESDSNSGRIYKFTPDGSRSTFASGLYMPSGIAFTPIPEPSTLALLGIGAFGLLAYAWRRGRASAQFLVCLAGVVTSLFAIPSRGESSEYTILHSFAGAPGDGERPCGNLTVYGSTLFSMTPEGVTSSGASNGGGTLFSMNMDGTHYQILHLFPAGTTQDGYDPHGSLTLAGSTLYGFGHAGGAGRGGTVFSIDADGANYRLLYQLDRDVYPYGALPMASPTVGNGVLYGTTRATGSSTSGIVFAADLNGNDLRLLHQFGGQQGDGSDVQCTLALSGATLYGMTRGGGMTGDGTVFSINTDGSNEQVLHNFGGGTSDGAQPSGGVIVSGNRLYGMTYGGGINRQGTIFSLNADGTGYQLLHEFAGGRTDGAFPYGDLIMNGSTLYGMTSQGGLQGTIFSIDINGSDFQLLHSFAGGQTDGRLPEGSLVVSGSTLYGMTSRGGANDKGVVFALAIPEPSTLALLGMGAIGLLGWAWRRRWTRRGYECPRWQLREIRAAMANYCDCQSIHARFCEKPMSASHSHYSPMACYMAFTVFSSVLPGGNIVRQLPAGQRSERRLSLAQAISIGVAFLLLALLTYPSRVAAVNWINEGTGDWFDPANWDGPVPLNTGYPHISNGGTAQISNGFIDAYDCYIYDHGIQHSGGTFQVRGHFQMYGSYELSGTALLDTSNRNGLYEHIEGTFTQSGGTHLARELNINGVYNMQGGSASSRRTVVGHNLAGHGYTLMLSGGSLDVGSLLVRSDAQFQVSGGTLTVSDSIDPGSPMAFSAGNWSLNIQGGFGDFTNATFADIHQASFASQPGTLTLFPAGTSPSQFASYTPAGLVHVAGSPLTIPAGQSISGQGVVSDHVIVYGTLTRSSQYNYSDPYIHATGGVEVHTGGDFNLGSGTLTVNDSTSAMDGGSLKAQKFYIGNAATGRFIQSGGVFDDGPQVYVGYGNGGNGYYELSAGTIHAENLYVGTASSTGQFRQLDGTVSLGFSTACMVSVESGGVYEMRGGSLRSAYLYCSNRFEQTGGTVTTTSEVPIPSADETGIYELSGGTHTVNGSVLLGKYHNSHGTYRVTGSGQLQAYQVWVGPQYGDGTAGVDGRGVLEFSGGSASCKQLVVGHRPQGVNQLLLNSPAALITVSQLLELGPSSQLSAVPGATIHVTGGTFDNRSTTPVALPGLNQLRLIIEGGSNNLVQFEVASKDLGSTTNGLQLNFALAALQVGGAAQGRVKLSDAFDNQLDGLIVKESLYVGLLEIGPGSSLDLNGLNLYYQNAAIDPLATITLNGGYLVALPVPEPSTLVLLGIGALGLLGWAWRRRKQWTHRRLPGSSRGYVITPRCGVGQAVLFGCVIVFTTTAGRAAIYKWDTSAASGFQGGNGTWGVDNYWTTDGTTLVAWPGVGNSAHFIAGGGPWSVTVSGVQPVEHITLGYDTPGGGYTLSGGTLNVTGGIIEVNQDAVVGSVIAGTVGVVKTGGATLTLSGANTYSGTTDVQRGVLQLDSTGVAAIPGKLTVSDGTVRLLQNNQIAASGVVTVSSAGTLDIGSNSNTVAEVRLVGGAITGSTGILTSTSPLDMSYGTASARLGGNAGLRVGYTGKTMILTGANVYSGATTIWSGALDAVDGVGLPTGSPLVLAGGVYQRSGNFTRALGSGAGQVRWSGNGGFSARGGKLTVNIGGNHTPFTWGSDGFVSNESYLSFCSNTSDSEVEFCHSINLNGAVRTIDVKSGPGGWAVLSGVLSGTGASGLTKIGNGTLTLAGANTYSGLTDVESGILQLDTSGGVAIPGNLTSRGTVKLLQSNQIASTATLFLGGVLDMGSYSNTVAAVHLTGGYIKGTGGTLTSTSNFDVQHGSILANLSGNVGLTKGGTALTVTLSGSNSFTGNTSITMGGLSIPTINNAGAVGPLGKSTAAVTMGSGGGVSGTLQFTGPTSSSNRAFSLVGGGTGIFEVATNSTNLSLSGLIAGAGNLVMSRGGTLTLTHANTYTGTTTISGGALEASDGVGLPFNSSLTLAGGMFQGSGSFTRGLGSSARQVRWTGSGGFAARGGKLTVNIGGNLLPLTWGATAFFVGGGSSRLIFGSASADNDAEFCNSIDLGGAAREVYVVSGIGGDRAVLSGVLSGGSGSALTKTGAGRLALTGANTYSGPTDINEGVLEASDGLGLPSSSLVEFFGGILQSSGAFTRATGSGAGQVRWGVGGFAARGGKLTVNLGGNSAPLTWGSNDFMSSGPLVFGSPSADSVVEFQNSIDLISNSRYVAVNPGIGGDRAVLSGVLSGSSGSALTKIGMGTLVLAGANTYQGFTTVYDGALEATDGIGLPSTSHLFLHGGVFQSSGTFSRKFSAPPGTGQIRWDAGGGFAARGGKLTVNLGDDLTPLTWGSGGFVPASYALLFGSLSADSEVEFRNSINFNGAAREIYVNRGAGGDLAVLSGVLSGGSGSALTKTGMGTLVLAADNTYTGPTTVSAGKLAVNGSLASASAVTVQNGGTLSGAGTVGGVTVNLGGHVAPGNSLGTLTLSGNLSLAAGARLDFELGTPGVSDQIAMPYSTLLLNGQQFSDFAFTPLDGFAPGAYTLIDAGMIQGSLGANTSGTINGLQATLSTVGNDVMLNVVPEPSTLVLLGVGAIGFLAWAWRWRWTVRQLTWCAAAGHQDAQVGAFPECNADGQRGVSS